MRSWRRRPYSSSLDEPGPRLARDRASDTGTGADVLLPVVGRVIPRGMNEDIAHLLEAGSRVVCRGADIVLAYKGDMPPGSREVPLTAKRQFYRVVPGYFNERPVPGWSFRLREMELIFVPDLLVESAVGPLVVTYDWDAWRRWQDAQRATHFAATGFENLGRGAHRATDTSLALDRAFRRHAEVAQRMGRTLDELSELFRDAEDE